MPVRKRRRRRRKWTYLKGEEGAGVTRVGTQGGVGLEKILRMFRIYVIKIKQCGAGAPGLRVDVDERGCESKAQMILVSVLQGGNSIACSSSAVKKGPDSSLPACDVSSSK
jgi:hypothetical protein